MQTLHHPLDVNCLLESARCCCLFGLSAVVLVLQGTYGGVGQVWRAGVGAWTAIPTGQGLGFGLFSEKFLHSSPKNDAFLPRLKVSSSMSTSPMRSMSWVQCRSFRALFLRHWTTGMVFLKVTIDSAHFGATVLPGIFFEDAFAVFM